jgi:hypothetical protein
MRRILNTPLTDTVVSCFEFRLSLDENRGILEF